MARQPLKITVATVAYNAGALIGRTINSVEEQDYPYVEHLIIDGNSTDDTLNRIHHYMERNSTASIKHEINCLSEPDKGIYDAMNKALGLTTGRYVIFLNAGDCFYATDTLSRIVRAISQEEAQPAVVYGDTHLVDGFGNFLRRRRLTPPERLSWRDFKEGMLVCHQAFFARTDLARACLYDTNYRFSADYDWTLRIMQEAERRSLKLLNAHLVVANYLSEGTTTRNHRRSLMERLRIMAVHFGWATALKQHLWFVCRAFLKK